MSHVDWRTILGWYLIWGADLPVNRVKLDFWCLLAQNTSLTHSRTGSGNQVTLEAGEGICHPLTHLGLEENFLE